MVDSYQCDRLGDTTGEVTLTQSYDTHGTVRASLNMENIAILYIGEQTNLMGMPARPVVICGEVMLLK